MTSQSLLGLLGLATLAASPAHAGMVVSTTAEMPHEPEGFGALNLDNVTIQVSDGSFGAGNGAYEMGPEGLWHGEIDDGAGHQTALLKGKDWPVGEPPGIKAVNDDTEVKEGKPQNCLMTTSYLEGGYLDTEGPEQTRCSSDFQTHKRFKVNMGPSSLERGVDLVFNVVPDGTSRDYEVFQKINNYTDVRLEGFEVQVGVGLGDSFQTASAAGLSSMLGLSTPSDIWDAEDRATFAHGLFGPADKHFPDDGFFDDSRAGYLTEIVEYETGTGVGDVFRSTVAQDSNYLQVPAGTGPVEQFGPWLPSTWIPSGYFFDDDGDPSTDAQLLAFWGETAADSGEFSWMLGNADGFAPVAPEVVAEWDADELYAISGIEDLLNLGLNYKVTVGTVDASWPTWDAEAESATFTLRMVPIEDTSGIGEPSYVDNGPDGGEDTGTVDTGGGDDSGDEGGDEGGDDSGDDGTGDDGTVDDSSDNSLEPYDPSAAGCGCASSSRRLGGGTLAFGLVLLGGVLSRRRRS